MPGIAWLALHPPKMNPFPWWTNWLLGGLLCLAFAMLVWVVVMVVADAWRDRKRRVR